MEEFINLHNRTVSRSEVERVVSLAKEQNNTEVIYRLSRILNAYPTEKRFVINIKDYPTPPTALAGAHHTGDYREALDENGRLKKGWKFSNGQVVKVTPEKAPDTPSTEGNKENKLYKFIVVTGHNFLGIYSYNNPKIEGFWQTNTTDNGIQIFTAISKGKKITKKKGISLILQKYTEGKDFIFVEYDYASLNKNLLLLEKPILGLSAANDELTFLAAAGIDYFEKAPDDEAQGLGKPIPAADIYKMITDKVISMFKNAKASDYHRAWKDDAFFIPLNFDSKKPYRGVNRLLLQERIGFAGAFRNPYFLTFNQIKKHGGKLKKGTRGYEVVYYSIRYIVPADKNTGRKAYSSTNAHKVIDFIDKHKLSEDIVTRIPMIRYYNVYNGASIEGIDFQLDKLQIGRAVPDTASENQAAALIVENYPNPPAIKHEGNQAYYSPSGDYVKMPKKEQFDSINDYYRTLFHELTHSTGHDKRLNRGINLMLEKEDYAKEELVAEFGAVFLSAWAGIMWYTNKNHAAYLKSWNSAIKEAENDNKFLMKAASLAQAATDYILNLDAAGQPAFLSKYEKPNKAEKPKKKAEKPKPESSLYEAFSELLSQIKNTNADIPSNELEDFLYNFGSQHYIEKKKIYTFFYDKVTKPIGSLSAYKKHPLFTKVKNPQPHHAGYTTTKRGTEILNIFIKDFEALKQQYDYNHYSFTKFWNIATEKPKKKAEKPKPEAQKATEKADNTDKKYKFIAFYNSYGRINGIYSYQNLTINEFYLKNTFDDGIKVYAPLRSLEKIEEAKRIIEKQYIEGKDFICLKFESKKREEYYSLLIHNNEKPKPEAPKAKKNTKVGQYTGVKTIPLSDLYTDEKRFQNRKKLNEEIVDNIVKNFKPTDLDPLVVWYDKKQGKTFVLAGHHRFEALKRLKHKNVPVKFANDDYPTEADAIRYAKEISNANRTLEEPYERAAIYRKYREEGYSEKEINDKAALEGKNRSYILNLSCLNPKGATMSTLVQFSQTQSKADKNEAERVADWIGQARRNAPELTDAHEKEMFDFLMNKEASKRTTTKVKFLEYVRACWNPFEPTAPLNLARMKYQSEGEKQYDEEVERYKTLISDLQNNIGYLKDRFINPANKDFVNPEAPDYMAVKKIADNKIAEYNTQIQYYQKELLKLYSNKQSYLKPTGQIALFGKYPEISTDTFKDMKVSELRAFTLSYYLTHLKGKKVAIKNHLKEVIFTTKAGRKIAKGEAMYKEKAAVIERLEELIKNSTYNNWGSRKTQDSPNILGYLNFKSKLTIDGEKRHVRIAISLTRERKTELKNVEVGKKKSASFRKATVVNPQDGRNETLSTNIPAKTVPNIEKSTTPPRKSHANPFCGDSAPTNIPAKTMPNTLANRQIDKLAVPTVYVEHLPEETNRQISTAANQNTLDAKMAALQTRNWETFVIANPQLQRFLGDVERKTAESTVITIAGGAGSGKTRFAFQFINALAQNYKVGHASLEEHPDSKLYYDKVQQYIDETALPNIEAPEIKDLDQLEALIQRNEVIVIDSFAKLQELNPRFLLDRDLRKKYDGKLFLLIYQLTGEGKMRGGSKSEYDGDIILLTHVAPDYRENYIYPSKNRYNALPATQLRYSTYFQQMLDIPQELGTGSQPTEAISLPPAPQTNVYEVIY